MTEYYNDDNHDHRHNHHHQQRQIIQCPNCKASITIDELGEHVNANPETKKEAVQEQLQLWGEAYDREYLIQNVVFCPRCARISHLSDWPGVGQ